MRFYFVIKSTDPEGMPVLEILDEKPESCVALVPDFLYTSEALKQEIEKRPLRNTISGEELITMFYAMQRIVLRGTPDTVNNRCFANTALISLIMETFFKVQTARWSIDTQSGSPVCINNPCILEESRSALKWIVHSIMTVTVNAQVFVLDSMCTRPVMLREYLFSFCYPTRALEDLCTPDDPAWRQRCMTGFCPINWIRSPAVAENADHRRVKFDEIASVDILKNPDLLKRHYRIYMQCVNTMMESIQARHKVPESRPYSLFPSETNGFPSMSNAITQML